MYTELINSFGMGIETNEDLEPIPFDVMNEKSVRLGYVIHPDCCNSAVFEWLNTLPLDYNATFYKEWHDITRKTRFELFVDQLLHYATTYGTDFSMGNGYVPNDGSDAPSIRNLKVLRPIGSDELFSKCLELLRSGIALKETTMHALCDFSEYHMKKIGMDADSSISILDSVKSKEGQAYLAMRLGLLPSDEFGILRCLVSRFTDSCMLIKDKETISRIKSAAEFLGKDSPLLKLTDRQMTSLSKIFRRFKPLILAMKTKETAYVVNRIRKYSDRNHVPFRIGFWESIVSDRKPLDEVRKRLPELDNFRKVRILSLLDERIRFRTESGVFKVRNGKMFIRKGYSPKYDIGYLRSVREEVRNSLTESISKHACRVKLPEWVDMTLPSSEKSFVGNFPFGSSIGLTKNNVVGIYWRNEWGTKDYDLSMTDLNGNLISWRASFRDENNNVIFSGDMTNADPEAVELLYIKDTAPEGIVKVNKFRGKDDSRFRFFFANEALDPDKMMNHMVDPNRIKVDAMVDFQGQGEKTIGIVVDNRFMFMDMGSGKRLVSSSGKYVGTVVELFRRKMECFVGLREILEEAGFTIVSGDEEADIDLTNPTKDAIIGIMS